MYQEGGKYGSVDPCYPSKCNQAHIHNLIFHKHEDQRTGPLNYIFFPCLTHVPTFAADFFPTALAAAHALRLDQALDGVGLLSVLRDSGATLPREALYWHYPHYHHSRPSGAVRSPTTRFTGRS